MKSFARIAVVVGFCAVTGTVAQAQSKLGTDPATFNKQYDDALVRNDLDFLKAILADDFKFRPLMPDNPIWSKARWLEFVRDARWASRASVQDVAERFGDVVVATSHVTIKYADPKRPLRDQVQHRIYRLGAGGWKMVSMRTFKEDEIKVIGVPGSK